MDTETIYEAAYEAARQAIVDSGGGEHIAISQRMLEGTVSFIDGEGRQVKETPAVAFFKKVTSVREKLRVLEQKLNNHKTLSAADKAELQVYITRCYGSLTSFNFMFAEDADKFRGSGG